MKKHHIVGALTATLFIISVIFFIFLYPSHQSEITTFTVNHPVLAPIIIIVWRFIGVVIPPIPGGVLSFALIPVLGWFWSFVYSTIGLLLGAIVAFFLARKYREPLLKRLMPLQELQQWEEKHSGVTQLWGFIILRMITEPVMDFVSYLAGLSKLRFRTFFIATFISLLPSVVSYYAGAAVYAKLADESPYVGIGFFVIVGILYLLYHRYSKNKSKASHGI